MSNSTIFWLVIGTLIFVALNTYIYKIIKNDDSSERQVSAAIELAVLEAFLLVIIGIIFGVPIFNTWLDSL